MAKNLSREQNEMLGRQKEAKEKFQLLEEWLNKREISLEQYNDCIRKIINRTMKGQKPVTREIPRCYYKASIETGLQSLIENLRSKLNFYLNDRNEFGAKLPETEIKLFKKYLTECPYMKSKINQLLIIGLRYPDKEVNTISEDYIKQHRCSKQFMHEEFDFWLTLWSDNDFVPLNAVRLMLDETDEVLKLNPCFSPAMLLELKPLIEYQRDKEILRLQWAQSLKNNGKREREVERKQRRLDAFTKLLSLF